MGLTKTASHHSPATIVAVIPIFQLLNVQANYLSQFDTNSIQTILNHVAITLINFNHTILKAILSMLKTKKRPAIIYQLYSMLWTPKTCNLSTIQTFSSTCRQYQTS